MSEQQYLDEKSPSFIEHKRKFAEFLDLDGEESVYLKLVQQMLQKGETRLLVNLNDLRSYDDGSLADLVLNKPMEFFPPAYAALSQYIAGFDNIDEYDEASKAIQGEVTYTIGIHGSFGGHKMSPRELLAEHLGTLTCVEGIVTKCSLVRPKVVHTVHYCEATNKYTENSYHDATSLTGYPTSGAYPTKDDEGNLLVTEFGLSDYTDNQTVSIQEMPEKSPAGQLPRSVDVVLDGDLVDKCKPGDRVNIIGIYRAMPSVQGGMTNGIFKSLLIANHVVPIGSSIVNTGHLTEVDIANIRQISKRKDVFKVLSNSIAPSIQGHEFIKKAMVLLLLGGVTFNSPNNPILYNHSILYQI